MFHWGWEWVPSHPAQISIINFYAGSFSLLIQDISLYRLFESKYRYDHRVNVSSWISYIFAWIDKKKIKETATTVKVLLRTPLLFIFCLFLSNSRRECVRHDIKFIFRRIENIARNSYACLKASVRECARASVSDLYNCGTLCDQHDCAKHERQ